MFLSQECLSTVYNALIRPICRIPNIFHFQYKDLLGLYEGKIHFNIYYIENVCKVFDFTIIIATRNAKDV